MKLCSVDNCYKSHLAKSYCSKHYYRLKRRGNVASATVRDYRQAVIDGSIARIPLGLNAKDGYAITDASLSYLDKYRWCKSDYPATYVNGRKEFMHNLILEKKEGYFIDHTNRNKLDNREKNLRYSTRSENNVNRVYKRNNSNSRFRGVTRNHNKWQASLNYMGVRYYGGNFDTPEEAAIRYNELAKIYHRDFAILNVL